jgi:type IV secretion system protein VirD4
MADQSPHSQTRNFFKNRQQTETAKAATETAHGSATFAAPADIAAARLNAGALLMGRNETGLLRYNGEGHLLTFAPTGAGKSVSVVVPNLLTYPGSVVCIDPKGAIPAITAARRRALGHNVLLFDPFEEVERATRANGRPDLWPALPRSSYNPLSHLDPLSRAVADDARVLAGSLIKQENDKNRYFSDSARSALEGMILFLLASGGRERLTVENLLNFAADSRENFENSWVPMMQKKDDFGGKIKRLANQIEDFTGEGGAAIWSTLRRSIGELDSEMLGQVMRPSSHDFRTLKTATAQDRPTTVYLVLPAHALNTHGAWLRLMLTAIMRQLSDARTSQYPVLFLVDECATLGRLELLETAVGLMRGYGMKLWLIFQDLPQLKTLYADRWQSFISNSGVRQFFNVNDVETADFVSQYLGDETRVVQSENIGLLGQPSTSSVSMISRRLLMSDEVRRLDEQQQILLYERQKPVRAQKLSYWQDSEFNTLAAADPYQIGKS